MYREQCMIVTLINNWGWELWVKQQVVMRVQESISLVCLILSHWETWRSIQFGLIITVLDARLGLEVHAKVLLLDKNGMYVFLYN